MAHLQLILLTLNKLKKAASVGPVKRKLLATESKRSQQCAWKNTHGALHHLACRYGAHRQGTASASRCTRACPCGTSCTQRHVCRHQSPHGPVVSRAAGPVRVNTGRSSHATVHV